jgi:hypothetical protein
MKKLTAALVLTIIALSSFAQRPKPPIKDSMNNRRVADSIRNNEPLFSRNDILDLIGVNIEGYKNGQGKFVTSRFEETVLKDDKFNGEECKLIITYAINIIAGDMKRMLDAAEQKKRQIKK